MTPPADTRPVPTRTPADPSARERLNLIEQITQASVASDLKVLLAYSTTENVGLILTAVAVAVLLNAAGQPGIADLGHREADGIQILPLSANEQGRRAVVLERLAVGRVHGCNRRDGTHCGTVISSSRWPSGSLK